MTTETLEVGQVYRMEDGYLVRIVFIEPSGTPWVQAANGRGNRWNVIPAWFELWERTS